MPTGALILYICVRIRQIPATCSAQHCTALHSTALHSTALHSTAQHSTALHSTAQHCTAGCAVSIFILIKPNFTQIAKCTFFAATALLTLLNVFGAATLLY
jgi:hypothetical protein